MLALGVIDLAGRFIVAADAITRIGTGKGDRSRISDITIEETQQFLRNLGELLVQTKNISEDDFALAVRTYWSAMAQITLAKQNATNHALFETRGRRERMKTSTATISRNACIVLNAMSWDIKMLIEILTMCVPLYDR